MYANNATLHKRGASACGQCRGAQAIRLLLSAFAAVFILAQMPPAMAAAPRKHVTLLPQWLPQAQFAGYYVALKRGFYADEGLDVTILVGGATHPASDVLAAAKTTFATMFLTTGIQKRASGTPLVNIAQIVRRSSLMLVAHASSGVRTMLMSKCSTHQPLGAAGTTCQ